MYMYVRIQGGVLNTVVYNIYVHVLVHVVFILFFQTGSTHSPLVLTYLQALESALNVLNGYSWSKFDRIFKIAITESNNKIFDDALVKNHTYHYNYRTFPLVLATLALIRHPDQVITRLLFDFYVSSV